MRIHHIVHNIFEITPTDFEIASQSGYVAISKSVGVSSNEMYMLVRDSQTKYNIKSIWNHTDRFFEVASQSGHVAITKSVGVISNEIYILVRDSQT